ncbi:sentrin-specific protease 7 isoform X2 [Salmo salar]|uniref:Sentrin-specific protease 7 isoform X2 n=1 Tax=Salmo salar TaxID=8030 RepID=A0A1S3NYR8_SALSA|nr:sentrin-specific protease 7 isoform X2 [Salmo salar]|eukprot:XP_014020421.1 PREDICTED: sentrin-specific protease 7-like isoform X2 [Salmo salar]
MMDHRRALTISLAVDKMGSPLKIPKTLLSSESGCGNEEAQIHWSQIAGDRIKLQDSRQQNGSISLDHGQVALAQAAMDRQIQLVLTDVLKTEQGLAYLDKKRRGLMTGNGERKRESWVGSGQRRVSQSSREGGEDRRDDPQYRKRPHDHDTPTSTRKETRSHHRGGSEEEEMKEVIIGEENEGSVSGRRRSGVPLEEVTFTEGERHQKKRYPQSTRTRKSNSGSSESTRAERERCRRESGLYCNGQVKDGAVESLTTDTSRHSRGSVLRLSGESRGVGGLLPKRLCLDGTGGRDTNVASIEVEVDPSDFDGTLMVVTVGEDEEVVSPSNPSCGKERRGTLRLCLSSSQDRSPKPSPAEPIVLSSDEEEVVTPYRSSVLRPQTGASESKPQRNHSQEQMVAEMHSQLVPVVVTGFGVSPFPSAEDSENMGLPFSSLHCGGVRGEASGNLRITNQRIIIPIQEPSGLVEVMVTVERCQLWRYSVWDWEELQERGLGWEVEGERGQPPPALLLLYVSDTQAAAVQEDLSELSIKQALDPPTGQASPFLLLTLCDPLEGVEGALLRSILDIICLNNTPHVDAAQLRGSSPVNWVVDLHSPLLSLDDSLVLVSRTGLDPQLLSLLGHNSAKPGTEPDQDQEPEQDRDTPGPELDPLDREVEEESQTLPETDVQMEGKQREGSPVQPRPVYTVCHHRTRGSYSVSLGPKPGSNWTRYTHQGPTRRLIQFPPPPSKGGITVTTEDLECLDNGQFLNDVIIDFYLKYLLLERAPQDVADRSHVFSSFFYKQLTRRDNASEDSTSISAQQRRHQRVKTWTRHVDIFKKDFLFVPVNQEAHWYLVVICFPGLEDPQCEEWSSPALLRGTGGEKPGKAQAEEEASGSEKLNGVTDVPPGPTNTDNQDKLTVTVSESVVQGDSVLQPPPGPPDCTEKTCHRESVCKRPCILIMDSLKFSLHERVFKLLREYLQSEWEVRRGSVREFSSEQMRGSHCKVPLQDNSSDCGLYLLQYVESFLQDPVVHFELPLRLEHWFPRQQVRRKRDEIRDLVLNLYRHQRGTVGSIGNMGNVGS